MLGSAIITIVGATIVNFVWQAFTERDWETAKERSYFQTVTVVVYSFLMATR